MFASLIECHCAGHREWPNDSCVLITVEVEVFVLSNSGLIAPFEDCVPNKSKSKVFDPLVCCTYPKAWTPTQIERLGLVLAQIGQKHQPRLFYTKVSWSFKVVSLNSWVNFNLLWIFFPPLYRHFYGVLYLGDWLCCAGSVFMNVTTSIFSFSLGVSGFMEIVQQYNIHYLAELWK